MIKNTNINTHSYYKNYLQLQGYMFLIIYAIILKLNLLLIFKYIFQKPCDIKN